VLDWGGSGRPLVLLAGLGNTAHIFDDFAPTLTSEYHVYGITRRGYGGSSGPASGYSSDRLGDDVLAVLDALKLNRPVLVGHSIAGEELSSVGTRHPERVAGLIYLDAGYSYAYYDRSLGNVDIDSRELQKGLEQLRTANGPQDQKQLIQELLQESLPEFERDLRERQTDLQSQPPIPPSPAASDLESFEAWLSWGKRVFGYAAPVAELRQIRESTPDGHVGEPRTKPTIPRAIIAGERKYTDIQVPVLAIFAVPHDPGPFANVDPAALVAFEARDMAITENQAKAFETGVPSAHVVRLPHANHYLFLSNEADVLREIGIFLASLH
jgi:pimeloyl-ACP methyl ester carboxylesterase